MDVKVRGVLGVFTMWLHGWLAMRASGKVCTTLPEIRTGRGWMRRMQLYQVCIRGMVGLL